MCGEPPARSPHEVPNSSAEFGFRQNTRGPRRAYVGDRTHERASSDASALIFRSRFIIGSLIGVAETHEVLDLRAEKGIVADIETIPVGMIDNAALPPRTRIYDAIDDGPTTSAVRLRCVTVGPSSPRCTAAVSWARYPMACRSAESMASSE